MTAISSVMEQKQRLYQLFQKFKIQCQTGVIRGTEPIILEFLHLFQQFVNELSRFEVPSIRDFTLELFGEQCSFLSDNDKILFPLPLYNVINEIKKLITEAEPNITSNDLQQQISHWINEFRESNFEASTQSIVDFAIEKIQNLEATSILTYGASPVVESILLALIKESPVNLHVKVIDGCASNPGKSLVRTMIDKQVHCTYGSLNCLANELTQKHLVVLLSASSVFSDGSLIVPRGTAAIVHLARSFNVPVLITVKSYQFIDKVSLVESEKATLDTEKYETISPDMVLGLITEIRILPPSSAPTVLKALAYKQ